jgi:antitoxin (DNA-binding transcriptional repressor) of toxin-antitoxin stability system
MVKVNTHEAKTKLSALIRMVEKRGEWVRICRDGKPIADLRPVARSPDPLCQHPDLKGVIFNENPITPLSQEDWPDDAR